MTIQDLDKNNFKFAVMQGFAYKPLSNSKIVALKLNDLSKAYIEQDTYPMKFNAPVLENISRIEQLNQLF